MTDRESDSSPNVLSGPWARRLILIDLALVAVLAWLLWSMWGEAHDPQPKTVAPTEDSLPAELEGLDY